MPAGLMTLGQLPSPPLRLKLGYGGARLSPRAAPTSLVRATPLEACAMKRCRRRSAAVPGSLCCRYGGGVNQRATEEAGGLKLPGTMLCHVTSAKPLVATATCGVP